MGVDGDEPQSSSSGQGSRGGLGKEEGLSVRALMESKSGSAKEEAGLAVCWGRWVGGEAVYGAWASIQGCVGGGGAVSVGIWFGWWGEDTSNGDGSFDSFGLSRGP